ncbi:hypothetical protein SAMN06265349_104324 [Flavobacterium resistens]|uniref:Uncharacterized protein n=1 Tax=Flavobacterium resistens TaxID=443612 RepID=A0A521EBF3_9FLAO|nr:hypothetical protein [Flavobacterium resistens]MRX68997.1 hypothetical protein [Flavobacterium resistens]SMO81223.1 hypothetical protein SAMN06265349_104324 [Flavobacterium resistens]
MKKKLEADLISIAHRILKLKNKSDINQLYLETQKLYEKLAILKFVDENFDEVKPTISHSEISSEIETIFEKEEEAPAEVIIETPIAIEKTPEPAIVEEIIAEIPEETTPEPIEEDTQESIEEPIVEKVEEAEAVKETETVESTKDPIIEKIQAAVSEAKKTIEANDLSFKTVNDLNPIPDFKPAFELEKPSEIEEPKVESSSKPTSAPIAFEDFGINYADAQFVKVDSFEAVSPTPTFDFAEKKVVETAVLETKAEPKATTLNEKLAKGFHIDLNDRIAFTKNLFGNSTEDYSRVLNQLLTFDTYSEAQEFIENMVKPDYNNWEGKDDYAERFLGIIEKKFA